LTQLTGNSGFSSYPRINLSPFTKDFRGEEHYNESIDLFLTPSNEGNTKQNIIKNDPVK